MRLALLKAIIAFLASIGIFIPGHYVLICNPGKSSITPAPTNCEHAPIAAPFPRKHR